MKLLTGVFLLFAFTTSAEATTIHFTASTCHDCLPVSPGLPDVALDLWLTVTPTTGEFFYQRYGDLFYGTRDTVIALGGTLNDIPVSLGGPSGFQSWMQFGTSPALLVFTIGDGNEYRLFDDGRLLFQVRQPDGYGTQFPVMWQSVVAAQPSAVAVPDASSALLLLAVGMASLAGIRTRVAKRLG